MGSTGRDIKIKKVCHITCQACLTSCRTTYGNGEVCKVCHKFIRILNTNPDINLGRFHRNQSNILRYNSERIVDAVDGCTRFIVRRLGLIGSKGLQGIFTNRKNDPFGKFRCSRIITTYTLRTLPDLKLKSGIDGTSNGQRFGITTEDDILYTEITDGMIGSSLLATGGIYRFSYLFVIN